MPYKPINGITSATAQTNDQRAQTYARFNNTGLGINGTHDGSTYTAVNLFANPTIADNVNDTEVTLFNESYNDYAISLLTELYSGYDAANDQLNPDFASAEDTLSYTPLKEAEGTQFESRFVIEASDRPYYKGPNIKVSSSDVYNAGAFDRVESGYDKSENNRGFGSNEKNEITTETIANYLNLSTSVLGESSLTSSSDQGE